MLKKVLVANRGEIAVRVLRALKELGVPSAAVYSEADRDSLHVRMADEALCIGPAPARESYLDTRRVLSAARALGCTAVHPGYGFLSENAAFARACAEGGLVFIGPSPEAIDALGNKIKAKALAERCGVPTVPGAAGSPAELRKRAREVGFPLMVKAAAGGGGKGLRLVLEEAALAGELEKAAAEAAAAFGDGTLYLERLIERPRHVEVQIFADAHGNVLAAAERDCSVQRRHQKLIEESPSPAVDPALRARMKECAVRLAREAGYGNLGTVEFLLDPEGRFYFIEVNTRLQVEHPVTEAVTGLDLVAEQIRIAAGEPLSFDGERADRVLGHAIEHRVNAEDPDRAFAPCPGLVERWAPPAGAGVRVDTHVYPGYTVPSYYDSLLAKLIVWAGTRPGALARSRRALAEFEVEGVKTTLPFHLRAARHPRFESGDIDTHFLERMQEEAHA